ncbi:hypothetical protein EXN66_Car017837 [Channa argus]|uniref:Uncharacterized protein n=1 Tax=Channa argus TaxID=215402 RepID=A0A6G1QID5_CHAAH|nr:hypothetical protein EXN66_Car017837 [Channa argus]
MYVLCLGRCTSCQNISPPVRPVSQVQKIKNNSKKELSEYLGARANIPQSNDSREERLQCMLWPFKYL